MNKTPIEWTDFTVNPFRFRNLETGKVGHYCEKISPGCKLCYADAMQKGPYLSGLGYILSNKPKGELFLDEKVLQQVLRRKKPCRIFWCDMTDMFLADYPDEWIDRCFAVMAKTPHLTHQVLTKRAERMREYATRANTGSVLDRCAGEKYLASYPFHRRPQWPLPNVHLGVSCEDQQRADERIPHLLQTPAAVRWVSYEPALGPVDFKADWLHTHYREIPAHRTGLDWIVIGGESGPGARPFDIAWARSVIAQCKAAGVKVFVKQLGAKVKLMEYAECDYGSDFQAKWGNKNIRLKDRKGGDMDEWPADLRVREFPEATHGA